MLIDRLFSPLLQNTMTLSGLPKRQPPPIATATPDRLQISVPSKGALPHISLDLTPAFVKNTGGQFTVDGKPFRYVGVNMYDLAHEKPETTEKMVREAAQEGFTVIRFWAHPNSSPDKLREIADLGQKYNMKFIPVLANQWRLSESDKKDDHWYKEGYKQDYLPYVEQLVKASRDRPEIMMWELINEPETEKFDSIYQFSQDVSTRIKQWDPNHLVSMGTIGGIGDRFGSQLSRLSTDHFKQLYTLPNLDALSIHDYSYDATALERLDILFRTQKKPEVGKKFGYLNGILSYIPNKLDNFLLNHFDTRLYNPLSIRGQWRQANIQDIEIAKELNKPLYIGEVGFKKWHGNDRKQLIDLDISDYFQRGAQGYMLWSFESQGRSIDGHDYGFTHKDGFAPIIKKWNDRFSE